MGELPKGASDQSTEDALLGEAPDVDRLAMERARARVKQRLFNIDKPARIGRYEILDPIGGGGMGTVYGAFDPQLQRKVALKVLHPRRLNDARAQQRMLVEGRALAKLDHPNIVKVHDVIIEDQQVIVVMELLVGETLERWQAAARRELSEIVSIYAQAAEGLAAAHGVEVIHRDFKPSNAIIGTDGRVRVVDFGLARMSSTDDVTRAGSDPEQAELTATGDVLGTLGFSSPEQLAGKMATAASDQFSFCVALHAAFEGTSPFTGTTPAERRTSIERGAITLATDGRRIPPWLRKLVARGLSAQPRDRHASMRDVERELRRARGWRRWRLPLTAAAALGITIASTAALSGGEDEPTCDGGVALTDSAWNAAKRDQVRRALQSLGQPYAAVIDERLLGKLDAYVVEWRDTHRSACLAHQRGETSDLLLDRQMLCLSRRLGDLRAAANVLADVDSDSLPKVMDVASAIPGASSCGDQDAVQSDVAPPSTAAMRVQVQAIRTAISSAEAEARAGRSEAALATLQQALKDAAVTPYRPVHVEVALAEGRVRLAQHDLRGAIETLTRARDAAFEEQMLSAGLEAAARIIYAEGQFSPQPDRLDNELKYLRPLTAGLRGDHFTQPLLINNVGTVYLAAGRRTEASRFFEEAKELIRRNDPHNLELTIVDLNLAMTTNDAPIRETLARGVWRKLGSTLGEQHRSTIDASFVYAVYVADPVVAFDVLLGTATAYERFHPTATRQIVAAHAKRAFLATELGNTQDAIELYRSAIASMQADGDPDVVRWRHLCTGELALLVGDARLAIDELLPVYKARISSDSWWERAEALRAQVGLGQAAALLQQDDLAIQHLRDAIRDYSGIFSNNEEVEYRRYRARAQLALARVLQRSNRDPNTVRGLEHEARAFYQKAGASSYKWILGADPGAVRNE